MQRVRAVGQPTADVVFLAHQSELPSEAIGQKPNYSTTDVFVATVSLPNIGFNGWL